MTTIHLDPAMVPASMRGSYGGKTFKASVCEQVTIPADAGLWSGGSRDTYTMIELVSGRTVPFPGQNEAPWGSRSERRVALEPGYTVVCHSMFCGKDMGLTFYVHADNAAKLLPAPTVELTDHEKVVLYGTRCYKSSYGGKDRYQITCEQDYGSSYRMSRGEWNAAKATLIGKGLLNKQGAITPAGRNAAPDRI